MKNALGYIRVSSEEQADHGLGLESQRQRIKAYCEMKGLDLVTELQRVLVRIAPPSTLATLLTQFERFREFIKKVDPSLMMLGGGKRLCAGTQGAFPQAKRKEQEMLCLLTGISSVRIDRVAP